jgi:sigma-E factor negative regulatory protein RseB
MQLKPLLALTFLGALCAFAPAASAQVGSEPSAQPREVRAWLMRIHEAASQRNFQGTFVVTGGGSVSSARIAHYCEGRNQFERIESLDGQARHVFRHNDLVQTIWPASRVAVIEQSQLLASFPALLQAGDDRIVEYYDVRPQGSERVAGHDANVLLIKAKDTNRFGYRLWSEKRSGLLLRADVIGDKGEVLETSAFSDVVIGVKPQPESVLQPMKRLDGYRVVRPTLTATRLEAEGWTLRDVAPGFRQVSCVRRPIDGGPAADRDGPAEPVLQAIYSDGLTYVSIFIEAYNSQRHGRAMLASVGATQTLMRKQGDWWITVVGDVPASTLKMFAKGLERSR